MIEAPPKGLHILYEEALSTVQVQGATIERIDEKAARLLRFNALVVGLVATGITLLSQDGGGMPFGLPLTFLSAGLAFLVVSTALAILAFRTKEFRTGLNAEDLIEALEPEPTHRSVLLEATRAHAHALLANARSIDRAVRRIEGALWTLLVAITCLAIAATGLWMNNAPRWF